MSRATFAEAPEDARRTVFQAGINRVQALTVVAINTLATLMGRGMRPTVRLGTARTVVELGIHHHDADTIMRKLVEIETHSREQDASRKR